MARVALQVERVEAEVALLAYGGVVVAAAAIALNAPAAMQRDVRQPVHRFAAAFCAVIRAGAAAKLRPGETGIADLALVIATYRAPVRRVPLHAVRAGGRGVAVVAYQAGTLLIANGAILGAAAGGQPLAGMAAPLDTHGASLVNGAFLTTAAVVQMVALVALRTHRGRAALHAVQLLAACAVFVDASLLVE